MLDFRAIRGHSLWRNSGRARSSKSISLHSDRIVPFYQNNCSPRSTRDSLRGDAYVPFTSGGRWRRAEVGKGLARRRRISIARGRGYEGMRMAKLVAQMSRCTMRTLVSHGRNDLFGTVVLKKSIAAVRPITTTRYLRAGEYE